MIKVFTGNAVYREVFLEDSQNYLAKKQRKINNKVNKEKACTVLGKRVSNKVFNEIVYKEVLEEDLHAYIVEKEMAVNNKINEQKAVLVVISDEKKVVGCWICTYYDSHHNFPYNSIINGFLYNDEKLYLNRFYRTDNVNVFCTFKNKQINMPVEFLWLPSLFQYVQEKILQMKDTLMKKYEIIHL